MITLRSSTLSATINPLGAELSSLKSGQRELVWQADPNIWGRHAPILFPIVGRLANDQLTSNGKHYPMSQHGFARDMEFNVVDEQTDHCTLALHSNDKTRQQFPFDFILQIQYQLIENRLITRYHLQNTMSDHTLHASIGAHPGFVWPLQQDQTRESHFIEFANNETHPIRRLNAGLMKAETYPTPVEGRRLYLHDSLFEDDAIIFDQLNSHELSYQAPNGDCLRLRFADFPHLGIWTKPKAGFICLEPWQGYASPEEFDGDIKDKPGIISLAANESRHWQYEISVELKSLA